MKSYLGDAVYVSDEINPYSITLLTGSHEERDATNIIHLDESLVRALEAWLKTRKEAILDKDYRELLALIPEDLRDRATHWSGTQIDIDNLEHDDVLRVMHALSAGRWERKVSGCDGKLDYITTINGWRIRLWAAGPPNSCRVVEEEYEVPAVPARKETRKRIICNKADPVEEPVINPDPID